MITDLVTENDIQPVYSPPTLTTYFPNIRLNIILLYLSCSFYMALFQNIPPPKFLCIFVSLIMPGSS